MSRTAEELHSLVWQLHKLHMSDACACAPSTQASVCSRVQSRWVEALGRVWV